jgi:hypothetical protein
MTAAALPPHIDTTVPTRPEFRKYRLDGTGNDPVDQESGDRLFQQLPSLSLMAASEDAFHGRTVRYLAREAKVVQFLDVDTGLPTHANTHQAAEHLNPAVPMVNGPLVLVRARAVLTSSTENLTPSPSDTARAPFQRRPRMIRAVPTGLRAARPGPRLVTRRPVQRMSLPFPTGSLPHR